MATKKITDLAALTAVASGDFVQVVDISDLTMAATGTNKKVTFANLQASMSSSSNPTGGFVNKFCNGAFDVWQDGTSGTITAGSPAYTADGFYIGCTGANVPWAQVAGRYATKYGLKATGAASVTDVFFKQRIESSSCNSLYPQATAQVTIQAKIYNATGATITPTLTVKHATAVDNWAGTTTDVNAVNLQSCPNTTLTTVSYTFASASGTTNGLEVTIDCGNNFSTSGKSVEVFEWDIRVTPGVATGLNASPPIPELRNIAVETAFCQRYYPVFSYTGSPNQYVAIGHAVSSTQNLVGILFETETWTLPTGVTVSNATHFGTLNNVGSGIACTSVNFVNATNYQGVIQPIVSSGLTAGNASFFYASNTSAKIAFTGCRL